MELAYDPAQGEAFWAAIRRLPGYPPGEERPIRAMLFEAGALFRLPEVLRMVGADPAQPLLVVMDPTPMRRVGEDLKPLVLATLAGAGWKAESVVLEPDATGQVHTDGPHIEAVKRCLRPGLAVVALGSGTVTDVAKHACFLYQRENGCRPPFVVYQTANSVSAYTSNMAPVFVEGVKRTLPSRYPDALICDLETLCAAPREMTVAGVGDLLAAFVSLPDWYLAYRLGLDPSYSELARALLGPLDAILLAEAKAIRQQSPAGMGVLAKLIALGGLAMSLSGATTPMSGLEHVISHVLDLLAEQTGRPLAPHGTQVALAALLAAEAYRRFLAELDPRRINVAACYPSSDAMRARIEAAFAEVDPTGRVAAECWADYRIKLEAWSEHRSELAAFLDDWPAIQTRIAELVRPPERLAEVLRAVDAPLTFEELRPPVSEAQVRFAFMNAPLMRKRLTLGDLLIFFRWDRERLWRALWPRPEG